MKVRIAYFGSPIFSAHLLEELIRDKELPIEVAFVVTQPDKPVGKKHIVTPSPVKEIAQKYQIPCWDRGLKEAGSFFATWDSGKAGGPTGAEKNDGGVKLLNYLKEVDLAIVFAYGFKELIPMEYLKAPKMQFNIGEGQTSGFINIHPSLLPLYRGSSPIAYPILLGEKTTGVSLFVMDEKMDHGPIVAQEKIGIGNATRPEMEVQLTDLGLRMVKKLPTNIKDVALRAQPHENATRAPYMVKDDGFIPYKTLQKALKNEPIMLQELPDVIRKYIEKYDFVIGGGGGRAPDDAQSKDILPSEHRREGKLRQNLLQNPAGSVYNFWRGMIPWPGVWTKITVDGQEKRLKLNEMKLENNSLVLTKVQLEGKKPVDFVTFQKAYGFFKH